MKKERLRIESLRKGTLLKDIQFYICQGEIVHCVFDNIQEKHMFLKIITGKEKADYGKIYYNERLIAEKYVLDFLWEKIAVVSRESILIDGLSVIENMFLLRKDVEGHWVNIKKYRRKAINLFEEFNILIDVEKLAKNLSDFEKVQIEILKAYLSGREIIVLTMLSNSLSSKEMRQVMRLLEKMREKGLSCIIVEPLEDIDFGYVNTVFIIKHGKTYAVKEADACDYILLHTILYHNEVNRRADESRTLLGNSDMTKAIEIQKLSSTYLTDVTFSVAKGEIVKLFCIDERSYEEITNIFRGKTIVSGGKIICGKETLEIKGGGIRLESGIGIVEGNPAVSTLFKELSVIDNIQMPLSRKVSGLWAIPKYKKSIKISLEQIIDKELYRKKVKELSPCEVQKVLYSKWLLYSPKLLVCIQPFAEGDIRARETAREMIYKIRERKIPLLLVTSNMSEFNYCSGSEIYIRHGKIIGKEEAYRFLYAEA